MLSPYTIHADGARIHSMLISLVELQHIGYAPERARTPRTILRAYNKSFIFAVHYLNLFSDPSKNTVRSVYGMPFHTISVHLAETLRLVSGQSIVAENSERNFNTIRYQLTLSNTCSLTQCLYMSVKFKLGKYLLPIIVLDRIQPVNNQPCAPFHS